LKKKCNATVHVSRDILSMMDKNIISMNFKNYLKIMIPGTNGDITFSHIAKWRQWHQKERSAFDISAFFIIWLFSILFLSILWFLFRVPQIASFIDFPPIHARVVKASAHYSQRTSPASVSTCLRCCSPS
jgi:hypothetical protein